MKQTSFKKKPHKCIICKDEIFISNSFQKSTMLTCKKIECKLEFIKFHPEKARKVHDIMVKKELVEMKDRSGKKKPDKTVLQDLINHIARLIDKDQVCISCSNYPKKKFGGHRWSVGDNSNLRYNLSAIMLQCFSCNDRKSGNIDGYDKGLLETFGEEYFNYVRYDLKRIYSYVGLSNIDLKEKIKIARSIIKELEQADKTYSTLERIELRTHYNNVLGIYVHKV